MRFGVIMLKSRVCDICGNTFEHGVVVKTLHSGINPWKKKSYICYKCENVMKLLVLQHRRKESRKI